MRVDVVSRSYLTRPRVCIQRHRDVSNEQAGDAFVLPTTVTHAGPGGDGKERVVLFTA